MGRKHLKLKWIAGVSIGTLLFLLSLYFFAPLYVNQPSIKNKIQAALSSAVHANVAYDRIDLSVFPRPHIIFKDVGVAGGNTFTGSLGAIRIYPLLSKLLLRRFIPARIDFLDADLEFILPGKIVSSRAEPALTADPIERAGRAVQAFRRDLELNIENGKIRAVQVKRPVFTLERINAGLYISGETVAVTLSAEALPGGPASLAGNLVFTERSLTATNVRFSLSHSSITNLGAKLWFSKPRRMEITSGTGQLLLDELSLLVSETGLASLPPEISALKGTMHIGSIRTAGPIGSIQDWDIAMEGRAESIAVSLNGVTDPLMLDGFFSIDHEYFKVQEAEIALGKSSVSHLSAALERGKKKTIEVETGTAVISLDQLFRWRHSAIGLQSALRNVSALQGTVIFSSMSFSGPVSELFFHNVALSGEVRNLAVESGVLPAPLRADAFFQFRNHILQLRGLKAHMGRSSITDAGIWLALKQKTIRIAASGAVLDLGQLYDARHALPVLEQAFRPVRNLSGMVAISSLNASGPLLNRRDWMIDLNGTVKNIELDAAPLATLLTIATGGIKMTEKFFSFQDLKMHVLDSSLLLSGRIQGALTRIDSVAATARGEVHQETLTWAFDTFDLPRRYMLHAPIILSPLSAVWKKGAGRSVKGMIRIAEGPILTADLSWTPEKIELRSAGIEDHDSKAALSLARSGDHAELSFSGNLTQATMNRVFVRQSTGTGSIKGTVRAAIRTDRPEESTARGSISATNLIIPIKSGDAIILSRINVVAEGRIFTITDAEAAWKDTIIRFLGTVAASPEGYVLALEAASNGIVIQEIKDAVRRSREQDEPASERQDSRVKSGKKRQPGKAPIHGTIHFTASSIAFKDYTFSPVEALISIEPAGVNAVILDAMLCGISTPGVLDFSKDMIRLDFKPSASDQRFAYAGSCLVGADIKMTGSFNLSGYISSLAPAKALLSGLDGRVEFIAKKGEIYRYPLLARILSLLSVTEIFRGKVPEFGGKGFPYRSITIKGDIEKGKFKLEEVLLAGASVDLIAQGEIDLEGKKMDLIVLVAPFSTFNWIIRHIPLIGKILGGSLVSVPVKVSGNLGNPNVRFLDPKAVGTKFLDLIRNILEIPIEIVSPFLEKDRKKMNK